MREIGFTVDGVGDTVVGLEAIVRELSTLEVGLVGADGDGSGLSRANYRSAGEWAALLVAAEKAPWFESFVAALPVVAQSGTLSSRLAGPATAGNVRAKTGTIIGGRALSGYLTGADGHATVFSVIVNGDGAHDSLAAIDGFVDRVARLTGPELADCAAGC